MKIKRTTLLVIALAGIFSLVAFVVPFEKNLVFVSAYVFGVAAIGLQLYFLKSAFESNGSAEGMVYGFPIARVGAIYLFIQLVFSLLEMVFAAVMPLWVCLTPNAALFVLAMAGCFAAEASREEVTRQEVQTSASVSKMKLLTRKVQALEVKCKDDNMKKELQKLAEALRFSDPVSSSASASIEVHIEREIGSLEAALKNGSLDEASEKIDAILDAIHERNLICCSAK